MGINFTPFELLTAADLNAAFREKADLNITGPQQFSGQVNAPLISASIALTTDDLTVTGSALFTTTDAMIIPIGSTLQRPLATAFGMVRANSSTGTYELVMGNGAWAQITTQAAATVVATAPGNLAGPSFGGSTANAIPVSWTLPGSGTPPYLYTLQYRVAGATNWVNWLTKISDSTTSATVSGLLDSTRYEFDVIAQNTAGSTTSAVTASSTLGFNPGGPTNLSAVNPTSTTVSLTWTGVSSNPISYQVRYATLGTTTWTNFGAATTDTFMTVSGLVSNQIYLFQVLAKNTSGSYESATVQATTTGAATLPPNAPSNLIFPATTINSVTVGWTPPTTGNAPFAYQVQYQVNGANVWTAYKTPTTSTSIEVDGLNSAVNYLISVIAINSAGSATSINGSATTLSAIPAVGGIAESQTTSLPSITGPILGAVNPNGALSNIGVTLNDPPAAYLLGSLIISVVCGSGMVTMTDASGNPIQGSGTSTISNFATSLSGAQTALGSLTYTAGSLSGTDSIRISVTDQLTLISTITISLTIGNGTGSPVPVPTPTPTPTPSPPGSPPGTLRTPTGQPTDALGIVANRSSDLLDRIVVVTRLENPQYNAGYTTVQAAVIENQINYIGNGGYLTAIREVCSGNMNPSWLAQISQNCGAFQYILAGDAVAPSLYASVERNMLTLASTFAFLVQGLEGFDPGIGDPPATFLPAVAEQDNINALAASTQLGLVSYQMAPQLETDASTVGDFNLRANVGTSRAFLTSCPNGPYSPDNDVDGGIHEKLLRAEEANPGNTNAIVAFGYQQFFDTTAPVALPGWVAETVAAKYIMEGVFDAYNQGSYYIGIHELQDADQTYGLFRNDGTPKIAAQALRILFQMQSDPSSVATSFFPGSLNYTITSNITQYQTFVNTGLNQLLLQNGSGVFFLWLWNEQPLNDSATNATIAVSNVTVTLNFVEHFMARVSLYDPFNPTLVGGEPQPYAVYKSVSNVPISLPAYPILILINHT
jgi:hypothetical protein